MATGRLAKTDSLDAAVLAHFADSVRTSRHPLRDAETQVLSSLVARRQQVMANAGSGGGTASPVPLRPSDPASRPTSLGASKSWTTWTKAGARPSARVLYGGRRTTCCVAYPASEI